MSDFKFACPMCGQHIRCDSSRSGAQLDCPTCFQKLIVPEPPKGDPSRFVLNAALAHSRRFAPEETKTEVSPARAARSAGLPLILILFGVAVAGGAVFAFRDKLFRSGPPPAPEVKRTPAPARPPGYLAAAVSETNWLLHLEGAAIPDTPVAGRIHGQVFYQALVILQNGSLSFRKGSMRPHDLSLTINLPVNSAWELAGKSFSVATNDAQPPPVQLRWRDEEGQSLKETLAAGYALRLDFGRLSEEYLPGRIYFCAPDEAKSYLAGTFVAEMNRPPPKSPRPPGSQPKPRR